MGPSEHGSPCRARALRLTLAAHWGI
jgi:hypothetical protein